MDAGEMAGIPKQGPVVAIDGPAGTGKSSTTRRLAEALGYVHVDTGALYRAVALVCLKRYPEHEEVFANGGEKAVEIARTIHFEFHRDETRNPANRIQVNGKDITDKIRTPEVSMMASRVSAVPGVRAALLGLQRRLGCRGKAILEGRDIGTVVFPDADVKFFLTASVDERAKRRLDELEATGADTPSFEEVRRDIEARDRGDMSRSVAPLKKAPDAVEIDTTKLTLDEVVAKMTRIVRERVRS